MTKQTIYQPPAPAAVLAIQVRTDLDHRAATIHALRTAAQAADDAFSAALQAAYGKRAGDMRYVSSHPAHPEVERAAAAYLAARNAYQAFKDAAER
jgi:hypothetical protein